MVLKYFQPNFCKEFQVCISTTCWASSPRFSSSPSNPTDSTLKTSLPPKSGSLPDCPITPITRCHTWTPFYSSSPLLSTTSCPVHWLPVWSVHPTPLCIVRALFQFFITRYLCYSPGTLTGLPTSCLSYPHSVSYTTAEELPLHRCSETCFQLPKRSSPCTAVQGLYNSTQGCRPFLTSSLSPL